MGSASVGLFQVEKLLINQLFLSQTHKIIYLLTPKIVSINETFKKNIDFLYWLSKLGDFIEFIGSQVKEKFYSSLSSKIRDYAIA